MARLLVVVTALLAQVFDPSGPLRGPIVVGARRAVVGRPLPDPVPAPIPRPIRDLVGVSYYTDASRSIADPLSKEMNQEAFAPLRAFVRQVTDLADGWMESRPARPAYAVRALEALAVWARAGALLGNTNQQGEYEREWTLGSLALAYLRLGEAPGLDPGARAEVEAWLVKLAAAVQPHYGQVGRRSSANNHACWAGLAVAVTGAATQNHALFDWGFAQGRSASRRSARTGSCRSSSTERAWRSTTISSPWHRWSCWPSWARPTASTSIWKETVPSSGWPIA